MALVNEATMEVGLKIVYCGPPMAGKSTNLRWVHDQLPESERGDLVAVSNSSDQIYFFDFHPSNGTEVMGYRSSFQLYTVPGLVTYSATRQLVLREVDAVVFVADSQPDRYDQNVEALNQLAAGLSDNGIDPKSIPIVVQFNKRDLPTVLPTDSLVEAFDSIIGKQPIDTVEASASQGYNVFETLNASAIEALNRLKPKKSQDSRKKRVPSGEAALSS